MTTQIKEVHARQILDSRGNPTLEVRVKLFSGVTGTASVPSGASRGKYEAIELRDRNEQEYNGRGVMTAINNVNQVIAPVLINKSVLNQYMVDRTLIKLDGTPNKSRLGANAILGVSMACAKAGAAYYGIPLYEYLGGLNACTMPVPMMNILNGGVHAGNNLAIQEFMIAPVGAKTFKEAIKIGAEVFYALKNILIKKGLSTGVGDEGGFAPSLEKNSDAIELIIEAIKEAKYSTNEIKICLDVAASEIYNNGRYFLNNNAYTSEEFAGLLESLVNKYPIISIEDGMSQDDWDGWKLLTKKTGNRCQLVGDDLFVTNIFRIKTGVEKKAANSVLIKPNQIGTVSETMEAVNYAKSRNYTTIISHRSGETEDTFIADLAVGMNSGLIKTGSLARSERVAKYNRLMQIEETLGAKALYPGISAFATMKGIPQ